MLLEELRGQFRQNGLKEAEMLPDPIEQFSAWFRVAVDHAPASWVEPCAMTLATSTRQGAISARVVLLRGLSDAGFVFYTNYDSRKGEQLAENPRAALVVYWDYLERQVRVEGTVARVDRALSEQYFRARPRGSQLSAAVSAQSTVVPSRHDLERQVAELSRKLGDEPVPLPDNWGGYCVRPERVEFWQGRENRLHDRILYLRKADGWAIRRLAP
jgi:pyridoxamine 5'-phosphate oxidase